MKKLLSILLCIVMLFSIVGTTAFAAGEKEESEGYPFIFVHGMGGWGSYEKSFYKMMPYWGGWIMKSNSDIIKIFNDNGIEAYAASVGPFNSAWDRACELYAQLTGTVVDYGEAHSAAHNHERYGFSYKGNQLMKECWDGESKLNLIGHSFGAPTVRLFASLLAYGDADEIAATGDATSPLFKGGHDNCINAVVTLAGTNNGSPVANQVYDSSAAMMLISFGVNFLGATFGNSVMMWGLQMSHFGLTPKQGEARVKLNLANIKNFANTKDNCGYDLTIRGAAELNERIKTVPSVYYYSYSAVATETDADGNEAPISTMFALFPSSSRYIGKLAGTTIDGITFDKDWAINDGLVPLASARYPMTDAATALPYEEAAANGTIVPGRWYYTAPMYGFDHFDFCGTRDYPTSFEDFYFTLAETVNNH